MPDKLGPSLGPALYRALDGVTDLACIVTLVGDDGLCSVTAFQPNAWPPHLFTQIRFDKQARANTVKPGTVYRE